MPTLQTMPTLESIMEDLRAKGSERYRQTFVRHGIPADKTFGVSNADLKLIAKTIKRDQALAMDLYATGMMDAMYLAGIVADGRQMTRRQLQKWAEGSVGMPMISEFTVPWVAVENPAALHLASVWITSKRDQIAAAGWCTYSGMVATTPDTELDLPMLRKLLESLPDRIPGATNRARYTINNFVISVGLYVKPLLQQAKATAHALGPLAVDMGDTACSTAVASASIEKAEASGRIGVKRKTIRC